MSIEYATVCIGCRFTSTLVRVRWRWTQDRLGNEHTLVTREGVAKIVLEHSKSKRVHKYAHCSRLAPFRLRHLKEIA
jgi:hypothetical protein